MTKQKWILFFVALGLIAGTAGLLVGLKNHPRLGQPGVKAMPIPGSLAMKIDLPERVLDFSSTNVPEPEIVSGYLPKDTSYAERIYTAPDGFWIQTTIVLMGADRTSIHNADYCLAGTGLQRQGKIHRGYFHRAVAQATAIDGSRWNLSGAFTQPDGQRIEQHGVYVFWFVADGDETPSHLQMMWRLALHVARTGVIAALGLCLVFFACVRRARRTRRLRAWKN